MRVRYNADTPRLKIGRFFVSSAFDACILGDGLDRSLHLSFVFNFCAFLIVKFRFIYLIYISFGRIVETSELTGVERDVMVNLAAAGVFRTVEQLA